MIFFSGVAIDGVKNTKHIGHHWSFTLSALSEGWADQKLYLSARDVVMTKILVKSELKLASSAAIFGSRFTVN
jgi:hypothetical protein